MIWDFYGAVIEFAEYLTLAGLLTVIILLIKEYTSKDEYTDDEP